MIKNVNRITIPISHSVIHIFDPTLVPNVTGKPLDKAQIIK